MPDWPGAEQWFLWTADGRLLVRGADGIVREATSDDRDRARLSLSPVGPGRRWRRPPRD